MAALSHLLTDTGSGQEWLDDWSGSSHNEMIAGLQLRTGMTVIAESLHLHNYKFLWDLLFERHPQGAYYRGAWEKHGDSKTEVPSYALIVEMLEKQPTALILDEFQTWYEGLTNTKQYPWRAWAFNLAMSALAVGGPQVLESAVGGK